ncbi:MAG: biopolymer transporter ExbD, partial [Gammaproteobacteria bacterium]|nr:biopolymer transporter ExbD [Gammaproteobacteria bacterium]
IAISEFDQVWMNKNQVELAQIRSMVESAVAEIPESSVIIIADEKASSGILIDLMDQVRLGGVANIMVAAEEGGN